MKSGFSLLVVATVVMFSLASEAQQRNRSMRHNGQQSVGSVNYYSQKKPSSFVVVEPMLGMTSSTFSGIEGKNGAKIESRVGFTSGMNILLGRGAWQFESGMHYAERGAIFKGLGSAALDKGTIDFKNQYLEIPVLVRYSFQPRSGSRFFLKGGLVSGFLIDSKTTVEGPYSDKDEFEKNAKELFSSNDFRTLLGLGGVIKLSQNFSWLLHMDYQSSVMAINSSKFLGDLNVHNSSLTLGTGLSFDI